MAFGLEKRQAFGGGLFSLMGIIFKWLLAGGIILLFMMIWFIGGYYHAKRRVRKALKPLCYHRFLLRRDQRAKFEPQNNFSFYRQDNQGYQMDNYGPPPPVYNPAHPTPPNYLPPRNVTKNDQSQEWNASPSGAPLRGIAADEEAGHQPGSKSSS